MPAFKQYSNAFQQQYVFDDDIKLEQFAQSLMESPYDSTPYSAKMFSNVQQDFKYEMSQASSHGSMQQSYAEAAPSLLSSNSVPSLPSASSSTVGSPYSTHAQPVTTQALYSNSFITNPAVMCDDYPYGYDLAHYDAEVNIGQDPKLIAPFIGKSANPTLSRRPTRISIQASTRRELLVSSPEPIDAISGAVVYLPRSKRQPSVKGAAYVNANAVGVSTQAVQSNAVFKSPSTSAPAYPRPSSICVKSPTPSIRAVQSQDSISFSYSRPFNSQPSVHRLPAKKFEYSLCSQSNDPVLISSQHQPFLSNAYSAFQATQPAQYSPALSPAPSSHSYHSFNPPVTVDNFDVQHAAMRRQSIDSTRSGGSPQSSYSNDGDSKHRCPYDGCGREFKDLKAHMMTHETVRPEKCPIISCEYHRKGFSRKYDKNRHTLTHYRGTMVCGFCPGSGSAAEKSFNRADVFKRHLTSVHGVEQAPPNSRKRSPSKFKVELSSYCQDATGKCSTCGSTFSNAQEFYEHLDDCVLKVVQQEDPVDAINAQRLGEVANDTNVQVTFERNHIKSEDSIPSMDDDDDDDDDEDEEDVDDELELDELSGRGVLRTAKVTSNRPIIGGNISKRSSKKGLTWSKGGGSIIGKSRKRRKFYPPSWGMATDKMNMKKRVLCVYEGQRRLLKDDMMMHNEFEVRMPLADGNSYVTDLDLETMKRVEAFHNATPEEKGPWIHEHDYLQEFLP